MIGYEEIGRALRDLDEDAKGVPFEAILTKAGVDPEGAIRAAKQRGLRSYMMAHGIPFPQGTEITPVPVSPSDPELAHLGATWLDGLLTGLNLYMNWPDGHHRRMGAK